MLSRPISRLTQPISISPGVGRRRLFLNLFLVSFLADNVAQLLPWSAMATHIGYTELIEYVDYTDDGSYSKLMGWPAQTNLAVKSTRFHNTTLEAWYPDTEPAVAWKPYRIVKKIPLVNLAGEGHSQRGTLRYHKDVGWHYRYSMPFRIIGKPPLPNSMGFKSVVKRRAKRRVKQRVKKPLFKLKKLAVRLKRLVLSIGLPKLRLRRIDQQPGFRGLLRLLN